MKDNLEVLFEDNHIIVVLKPQNVPTQEDSSKDRDLLSIVKDYVKEKYNKPGNVFIGLVHRLDRPTGGVMVFARTSKAAERLSNDLREGEFDKTYFAVVCGVPKERKGYLVHYLKKDEVSNTVKIVPMMTEGAKKAELEYEVLESKDYFSLVKIKLLTGRSHQARVQMASLNTPIFADTKYGDSAVRGLLNLYCVDLRFNHPTTHNRMVFKVIPPEQEKMWNLFDLERYLKI